MRTLFGLLILSLAAPMCRATFINFDNVTSPADVTNQYPGVVFSTEPGLVAYAYDLTGALNTYSAPNVLTPLDPLGLPRGATSIPDMYADFTTPVNNLSFLAVAADEFGTVARVKVFSGPALLGIDPIIGGAITPGTFGAPATDTVLVNLSAYSNITRIEIVPPIGQTDLDNSYNGGGLVYDDFSFEPVTSEPEPACLGVLAAGALMLRLRRNVANKLFTSTGE